MFSYPAPYIIFLIFVAYFLVLTVYYFACGVIALIEVRTRGRQHQFEDYAILAGSMFTLPVSVLIPSHNEQEWILDTVKSVLSLEYPEFEVIVIDDGSTDNSLPLLQKEFDLEPAYTPRIHCSQTGMIKQFFQSKRPLNLRVISKESGYKKAGALNAGLEFARYPYVCILDADTILEPDALLKVMTHVLKDPENIIGAGSYFGLVNGFKIEDGRIIERSFSFNPFIAYQNLEYLRSFIGLRAAWSKFNATPIIAGGFAIWRKDILLELGGFSSEHSSEDVEITFRARDYIVKNKKTGYQLIMLPYFVGWTEGPATLSALLSQRDRWHRCLCESVWQYRHMIGNPRFRSFGIFTLPYLLLYESLGVFFEFASIGFTLWGWMAGVLSAELVVSFFVLMAASQTMISLFAIFAFVRSQQVFKVRIIAYFILLAFLEMFCYRWLVGLAKIRGMVKFFRGVRGFDRYSRQQRYIQPKHE